MARLDTEIDYYAVLGVTPSATRAEIRRAFRALARQYHPDATRGDRVGEARFREFAAAYEVVGDDRARAAYDRRRGRRHDDRIWDLNDLFARVPRP